MLWIFGRRCRRVRAHLATAFAERADAGAAPAEAASFHDGLAVQRVLDGARAADRTGGRVELAWPARPAIHGVLW